MELQYRTRAQHAWATAVEISDLLDDTRTKFVLDESDRSKFFAIASEIIARVHEDIRKSFLNKSTEKLLKELKQMEHKMGIINGLKYLKKAKGKRNLKKHNVLNLYLNDDGGISLEIKTFTNAAEAIEETLKLEDNLISINAVYVRADNYNSLSSAYRNYFNDPFDFVQLIENAYTHYPKI